MENTYIEVVQPATDKVVFRYHSQGGNVDNAKSVQHGMDIACVLGGINLFTRMIITDGTLPTGNLDKQGVEIE